MSAKQTVAGPFSSVYIGVTGVSTILTRLKSIRTGGATLTVDFDEDELAVKGFNSEQASPVKLKLPITFYGDAKEIYSLAMGTWNPSYKDAPSTLSQYVLLFIHPLGGDHHLYLPVVRTKKSLSLNWNKDRPTELPVIFQGTIRNRFNNPQLFYQRVLSGDSPNDLKSLLAGRYPL